MPAAKDYSSGGSQQISSRVNQLLLAPSDDEYLDQLINLINDAQSSGREYDLVGDLRRVSQEREQEIERLCNTNHQDFVASVEQLLNVRKGTVTLTEEILELNESIQKSTQKVVEHKKALVDSRDVRQNIDEATKALQLCLEVLGLANKVSDLLRAKKHYAALRTLDELQNVHLKEVVQFDVADLVQQSVPSMKGKVKEAVWSDLTTWLYKVRENSQLLGQVAFDQTELRRRRQKERVEKSPYLEMFKLNSAIELVLDEREEFDVLNNENVTIDFTPFFECLHIHEAMGERDEFKARYTDTRRQQKDLLVPTSITIQEDDTSPINQLLEGMAGFAIVERATVRKAGNFRSAADVDELWSSLSKKAIQAINPAIEKITVSGTLLKIKNVVALFIQTMDTWGYTVELWDGFLLNLFHKYSALLKREFTVNFRDIVENDDYMPMPIENREEYDKVCSASWYTDDRPPEEITFPTTLPFSQMYPLCCADIRNFLNKYYYFADDYFSQQSIIDNELRSSLDELLKKEVCTSLVSKLSAHYLGQIVQILINLSHFTHACTELEALLASAHPESAVTLTATSVFSTHQKTAEKRIFELVNSKIDDLVETAEYEFGRTFPSPSGGPSPYLRQATMFLQSIMGSTLVTLPKEISGLVYFDALNHLASSILGLMMSDSVPAITKNAVGDLWVDVEFLRKFVEEIGRPELDQVFEELRQTVELMRSGNGDEFYEVGTRMKKYANVDPLNGPMLLEKVHQGDLLLEKATQAPPEKTSTADRAAAMARSGLARFRVNQSDPPVEKTQSPPPEKTSTADRAAAMARSGLARFR